MMPDDKSNNTLSGPVADTTAPSLVNNSPLTLRQLATATITSSTLQFTDNISSDANETYTVTAAPHDGLLLLDGSPTSSFTQAEIDAGEVGYRDLRSGSDSFAFTVSDAAGNKTAAQQFQVTNTPFGNPLFGSQYAFFVPGGAVNVVYTPSGANLPVPVFGAFNLDAITSPTQASYPLPPGYQGLATFPGGSGTSLSLLVGDVSVVDTGLGGVITLGSGNGSVGGGLDDTITGGTGTQFIDGSLGNESITGGSAGNETIWGGVGDTISGGTGANVVIGGVHNDTIIGGAGTVFIDGSGGNQSITGGSAGSETIWGGAGDAINGGTGANVIIGGVANDTITGGTGTLFVDGSRGQQLITGGSAGNETIWGGAGDTISGGSGASVTIGGVQFDTIDGGAGAVFIDGTAGNQSITIGSGLDTVWGGADDTVIGGSGQGLVGFGAGAEFFSDAGTAGGTDTVGNFSQAGGDRILLNGLETVNAVLASASISDGSTTITFADHSTLTLLGVTGVNSGFFG
jgi:Ca2+-binding RTX toxin-like protein